MTLDEIDALAAGENLAVFGALSENCPEGIGTLVLLGPREPGFWAAFSESEEYRNGKPDPLDRWSVRVVGGLADRLGAVAFFPFGGPPYQPFVQWSQDSRRTHVSPVGLLVHDMAGLMVSYRGALGFTEHLDIPKSAASPCLSCDPKPCLTACPVDAFAGGQGYDVPACKADLDREDNDCLTRGCAVRRACPVSQSYGRLEAQSAFHMRAFK